LPLDAPDWSASRTAALSPEMELGTHSTEDRAGLRDAQGIVQKRKTFVRAKSRIPNRPAHRSVTAAITLYRLVVTFQLRQNFRTDTSNMLSSIYTASTLVPSSFAKCDHVNWKSNTSSSTSSMALG